MMCQRCEDLENEIAWLRSELGVSIDAATLAAMRGRFGLSRVQAIIVMRLFGARCRPLTPAQIVEALPPHAGRTGDADGALIKSHVCRIRKVIGQNAIETVEGVGYRLSSEAYSRVLASRPSLPVQVAA